MVNERNLRAAPGADISNGATQQPAIDGAPADGAVGPLVCQATARCDARTGRSGGAADAPCAAARPDDYSDATSGQRPPTDGDAPAGDIQGSMESAGAQQAQRSAASAGLASALPWGLASTAAVAAGSKFSPAFAKSTSPSARVALAISPPLFAFFLAGDLRVHHDAKNRGDVATARSSSTWPLRLANAFYNHTLIAFGMVITPMYGAILHSELSKPRYEGWRLSRGHPHARLRSSSRGRVVWSWSSASRTWLGQNGAPFKVDVVFLAVQRGRAPRGCY